MRPFHAFLPLIANVLCLLNAAEAHSQAPSAIKYVSTLDNPVINTPSHRVSHLSHFDLTFSLHGGSQRIRLELEPNNDILAEDASVRYLDAQGNIKREEPIDRVIHRVFKGRASVGTKNGRWDSVGWARIYMKRDGAYPLFEGAFSIMNDDHHIELHSTYLQKRREGDAHVPHQESDYMVVYRDSDIVRYVQSHTKRSLIGSSICHADKLGFNSDPSRLFFQPDLQQNMSMADWSVMSFGSLLGLTRRQSDISGSLGNSGNVNLRSTIGSTAGCPTTRKIALIGVATDCEFTQSFNSTQTAREWVISVVNTASNVYEKSFNISLGLRNLTVSDAACPESASSTTPWNLPCSQSNITSRLNLFSQWRGSNPDSNAYWTLMSNCPTGSEVGLSWLGQLCNTGSESEGSDTVSGTNFVARTQAGWQVFAHESGHTFGAVHDCDSQTCTQGLDRSSQCCPVSSSSCDANGDYIMNPSAGSGVTQFSPCTIGNICSAMGRNSVKSQCLSDNHGVPTITPSQCGNGIVEEGEDCDCGGDESCANNNCCDPNTCKYKSGAVCDDSNDSCCTNCQFASADTVCRPSTGPCDIEEKCTGTSSACPSDSHKPDGSDCGVKSSGLTCASGQCTSRDQQCQDLLGSQLNSNDTQACDDVSCLLTCTSSTLSINECATTNKNFLDGTPCRGGGHCQNGRCEGSSFGKEIESWVDKHKGLVIGLAAGIGGPLVLCILWCLISQCCCGRRAAVAHRPPPPPVQYGYTQWHGAMPASYTPLQPWPNSNARFERPSPPYQGYQGPPVYG